MKKMFSVLIILCILTSTICFTAVSASGDTLTPKDVENLLINALRAYNLIQDDYVDLKNIVDEAIVDDKVEVKWKTTESYFLSALDGTPYENKLRTLYEYAEVTDARFDTLKECYSYAEQWFETDLAKNIVDVHGYLYFRTGGEKYSCFRLSDGGYRNGVALEPGKVMKLYHYFDPYFCLESFDDFTQNGDTATLKITYSITQCRWKDIDVPEGAEFLMDVQPSPLHPDEVLYAYYKMERTKEVILKHTADGWKVSGGSFMDTILFKDAEVEDWMYGQDLRYNPITGEDMWGGPPKTSDSTPIIITLLTLSGIVLACVPAVKRRRR